ncbi:MAG: cyclic nucleotide-binding domain-containing protein [Isosphaeraceae bacterium]|nr:cyclic nucleotide-binding domain-containing protein [Isosphaeraceae bacterium]
MIGRESQQILPGELLPPEIESSAREAILAHLEPIDAPSGTMFLSEGERNDRMWFLTSGSAVIERKHRGGSIAIANLLAPAIFGATTFFRPTASTVTIRATSPSRVLALSPSGYDRLKRDDPRAAESLARATIQVLSERFDLLDQRMNEFMELEKRPRSTDNEWTKFRARLFGDPNII